MGICLQNFMCYKIPDKLKYYIFNIILLSLLFSQLSVAAPFKFLKTIVYQPDSSRLELYASGDEFYNWLHDKEGYTIIQDIDGYYCYAQNINGELSASPYKVGQVHPDSLGIPKWLKKQKTPQNPRRARNSLPIPVYAPHSGNLNNVVIFISFQDDSEFSTPRSQYEEKFNKASGPSLKHYYQEVSYGKFTINSSFFPSCPLSSNISYKAHKNRGYYEPKSAVNPEGYTSGDETAIRQREHGLIKEAIIALKNEIETTFSASDLDQDGDGFVDNVSFVLKGNSGGWSELLWAHRWSLYTEDVRIHGKRVYDYVFQPENQVEVRTLCHEMFHSLGAPDLYHYSYDGFTPVGIWDLMENSDAHMGAYMKWKYAKQAWIKDIPEITCPGRYTLSALKNNNVNVCYKIKPQGTTSEFFIIEYRKAEGLYESSLPGSGLLIYRINPSIEQGNRNGPPDEVYIYRPGGTNSSDGDIYNAHFALNEGRTDFNLTTNPRPFLSDGSIPGLSISQISETSNTISFTISGIGSCSSEILDTDLVYRSDTVCQGDIAHLQIDLKNKIGECSYIWNPIPAGNFIIQNGNSAMPSVPTASLNGGRYEIEVWVTDHGVSPARIIRDTVSFVILDNPHFTLPQENTNHCLSEAETVITLSTVNGILSGTPPFAYNWSCDRTQITSSTNQANATANILLECNKFQLTVSDSKGCSASDSVIHKGHRIESHVALHNTPLCNTPAILSVTMDCPGCHCSDCFLNCNCIYFLVEWGPQDTVSGSGNNAITIPLTEPTEIWTVITDEAGCSQKVITKIPVEECKKPAITLSDKKICELKLPTTIKPDSIDIAIGPVDFFWDTPWGNQIPGKDIIIPPGYSGSFNVTVTMVDNGFKEPKKVHATANIEIIPIPDFEIIPSNSEGCINENIELTITNYPWQANCHWLLPNGGYQPGTPYIITPIAEPINNYSFIADAGDGCILEKNVRVQGHGISNGFITPNTIICSQSENLSAFGFECIQGDFPIFYHWFPENLFVNPYNQTVTTYPIANPIEISVTVSDHLGCNTSVTQRIDISVCQIIVYGDTLCQYSGNSADSLATPSVIASNSNPSYLWKDISGKGLIFQNPNSAFPNINVKNLAAGIYPIEVEIQDGISTQKKQTTIVINPIPKVKIQTDKQNACVGETLHFTTNTTPHNPNYKYVWTGGATGNANASATIWVAGSNQFTINVKDPFGCQGIDTLTINGHLLKKGHLESNPKDIFLCNDSGVLKAVGYKCLSKDCPLIYTWTPTELLATITDSVAITQKITKPGKFKVIVQDEIGCKDSSEIIINTGICNILIKGDTLCSQNENTAHPLIIIQGGTSSVKWKAPNHNEIVFNDIYSFAPTIKVEGLLPGAYPIQVDVNDGTTTTTYETNIKIIAPPTLQLQSDKNQVCAGEEVCLTADITPLNTNYHYYWSGGSGENNKKVTIIPESSGDKIYRLKITDEYGCSNTDSIKIKVLDNIQLCAATECIDNQKYRAIINILQGTLPYEIFNNEELTISTANVEQSPGQIIINSLKSDSTYKFYINGAKNCKEVPVEVVAQCDCETGLIISTDSINCSANSDHIAVRIMSIGTGRFSFDLVAPNGTVVLSPREEEKDEWVYYATNEQEGLFTIQNLRVHSSKECKNNIYGNANVYFPEKLIVETDPDMEICSGESITLRGRGNACHYEWDNGIINDIPFSPTSTTRYHLTGYNDRTCTDSSSILVTVLKPIRITYKSHDLTIKNMASASFEVYTDNQAQTYIWQVLKQKNWENIYNTSSELPNVSGGNTHKLILNRVPYSWNLSKIRCIVKDKCGTDTTDFNLTVIGCPEVSVTLQMEDRITPDEIVENQIDGWFCRGSRIGVRAILHGANISQADFRWTINGLPVDYSSTDYISWIPETWDDDLVLKVCVYSRELCEPVCSRVLRLKSKAFEQPSASIITSIDPRRTFCKGEVIHFDIAGKNLGEKAEHSWYNDIFYLGKGSEKNIPMGDQDTWIKVITKVDDDVCVKNRILEDTLHLKRGEEVTPTLNIITTDTTFCPYEEIQLKASYQNAGKNPTISWQADIWNLGTGETTKIIMNNEDTWVLCHLQPDPQICYYGEEIKAYKQLKVISDDPQVTIISDQENKHTGDLITFQCSLSFPIDDPIYSWHINGNRYMESTPIYESSSLKEGDIIQCFVSGKKVCQLEMASNIIKLQYRKSSLDTSIIIFKNESLKNIFLNENKDRELLFLIEKAANNGMASLTIDGIFGYIPFKNYVGTDIIQYVIRSKANKNELAKGNVYITVIDDERYFIPNIITPNHDGINDTWVIDFLKDYPAHEISLYNRNGILVYNTRNYQNNFDASGQGNGYVNQTFLPHEIYSYVISLGNKVKLKGWLEVRR